MGFVHRFVSRRILVLWGMMLQCVLYKESSFSRDHFAFLETYYQYIACCIQQYTLGRESRAEPNKNFQAYQQSYIISVQDVV
jgi:hypothetical protein